MIVSTCNMYVTRTL